MELVNDKYKNIYGEEFSYKIIRSNIPNNADYYMYNLIVEVIEKKERRNFLLFIRKSERHKSWKEADLFVQKRPLEFLKKAILNEYQNGSVPLRWPAGRDWLLWGVLPEN